MRVLVVAAIAFACHAQPVSACNIYSINSAAEALNGLGRANTVREAQASVRDAVGLVAAAEFELMNCCRSASNELSSAVGALQGLSIEDDPDRIVHRRERAIRAFNRAVGMLDGRLC
jgi:hypothetical protein